MSESKTYGYFCLNEKSYQNLMNPPNFGPKIPSTGYNWQATGFICQNFAKQTQDCGFIDTSVMLNYETRNAAQRYVFEKTGHQNLITGEIMVTPEQNAFYLLDDVSVILAHLMLDKEDILQKIVVPLTIYSSDKEPHGVALCIEKKKKNDAINIIILEQHAKRDQGNLDFSKEVNTTLEHLKSMFEQIKSTFEQTGIKINMFQNDTPICREKGVCSVVSLEVCKRLLQSDEPLHTAKLGLIKINAEQVQKLHQENFQNWQKNGNHTNSALSNTKENTYS